MENVKKPKFPKKSFFAKIRVLTFILLIAYIIFLLGKTVWQNYGINKQITGLKDETSSLKEDNKKLENLIEYYQSNAYKETEARLKLGYQKPGERVYVIPDHKGNNAVTTETDIVKNENSDSGKPNYLKWWEMFFGS